jgi:dTDP-4-dehydrorhamnose reductase
VSDFKTYERIVKENKIDYIVHLAAILSALGEKEPDRALKVNVDGAINALNLAREVKCQVFIPSTIAVFGGDKFPKVNTPVDTIL